MLGVTVPGKLMAVFAPVSSNWTLSPWVKVVAEPDDEFPVRGRIDVPRTAVDCRSISTNSDGRDIEYEAVAGVCQQFRGDKRAGKRAQGKAGRAAACETAVIQ